MTLESKIDIKEYEVCCELWFIVIDHGSSRCERLWCVRDRQIPCTDSLEIEYIEYL